jgi:hypothetical protein
MITQHHYSDLSPCPVKVWVAIMRQIQSYPSLSKDSLVSSFLLPNNKLHHFMGSELLKRLHLAVAFLGPDVLGFTAD